MGIQSGSLSLCRYRLVGGAGRTSLGELNELIDNYKSGPIKLSGIPKEELFGWVRPLGVDQLKDELGNLRKEAFNLRFQKAGGQLQKTARARQVRRDIARIKTVLGEKAAG